MVQWKFTKMQGLGNDFIILDDITGVSATSGTLSSAQAIQLCDRRLGIGADQILWLRKPRDLDADLRMEILNSDGSTAEMCGNGIRAVALYYRKYGKNSAPTYRIETLAGLKTVEIVGELEDQVCVDMGVPGLPAAFVNSEAIDGEAIEVGGKVFRFYEINVGNPHAVIFVPTVSDFPVAEFGALIEKNSRFPKRTNVEFVEVVNAREIRVRVWERGSGLTLACGTGACAAAVASRLTGQTDRLTLVQLPGGSLQIDWPGPGESVKMTGPAREVFRGAYTLTG